MPRSKSIVWKFFKRVKDDLDDNKNVSYKCNYCGEIYVSNVTRQRKHLEKKCLKCPQTIKELLKKKRINNRRHTQMNRDLYLSKADNDANDDTSEDESDSYESLYTTAIAANVLPHAVKNIQNTLQKNDTRHSTSKPFSIKKYFDSITSDEQERLDEKLSKAIYSSDCALLILDNQYWIEFLKELRPSWKPPSTYKISTPLLDKEHTRIQLEVNEATAQSTAIGIQCDGWSNRRNESIVNFVVTTPETLLYKTMDVKGKSHTGEYMAEIILEVIEEIGTEKVLVIVTDSASNMVKARRIVQLKYPHIYIYNCEAHCLNLLVKDIIHYEIFKNVQSLANELVKEVNSSHLTKAKFTEIQKERKQKVVSLKLPGKTRWGSIIFCLESLLYNKKALKILAISEGVILKSKVENDILSESFWCGLLSLHEILAPIVKWITILEANCCTVSSIPRAWNEIQTCYDKLLNDSPLSIDKCADLKKKITNRSELSMQPFHFAANILDPKYNGEHLTRTQRNLGIQVIHDRANYLYEEDSENVTQVMTDLAYYIQKEGSFGEPFVKKTIKTLPAITWWKTNNSDPKLCLIAVDILSMPATSAAMERSFSRYGNVHTIKRKRLTTERAGKLTYVSFNLKLESSKKRREKQKRIMFITP